MANFAGFIRNIRRRAREVETGASRTKRRAALAINQALIFAVPVKSGHARANFQVGLGAAIQSEIDEDELTAGQVIARNNGVIGRSKPRQAIYISNNVPYIGELNRGSSSQAPAMFVQIAVQQALSAVAKTKVFKR